METEWAGPCPKAKGEENKKHFSPHVGAKPSNFINASWPLDLPGQGSPHLHAKISTPPNSFGLFGTRDKSGEASPPLRGVNEAFNHLLFLLLCLLFISVCRNQRNAGAWQKAAIERLCVICPRDGELIAFWLMSPSEPGLRGGRREKGGKSAALLQPRCFLGCHEGVKEPKAGWGGMVGRQREKS